MRSLVLTVCAVLLLAGCGEDAREPARPAATTATPDRDPALVAVLGDSITAGSPLYDPDPATRARIGSSLDADSQWETWYRRAHPGVRLRNCGVLGERTDQIAQRLDDCARGAGALVVQGGINDIAQGRPVPDAADDLRAMIRRGKDLGLRVATVEVLPWNNGYPAADPLIRDLNARIRAIAREEGVPVARWYGVLEDPRAPGRMRPDLTIDGDHPSIAGYRRLAARVRLPE